MRDEFSTLADIYPKSPAWRGGDFKDSPIAAFVQTTLPLSIEAALGDRAEAYLVQASAGQGGWTHTPWAVLLDPAVTSSVEEGFYVVYLLSKGGDRLYLTLNQGCTSLKDEAGLSAAREMLEQRAAIMWSRASAHAKHFRPIKMDLSVSSKVWRGKLYERGAVAGIEYQLASLPSEALMRAHLDEALHLYGVIKRAGGWDAEDALLAEMKNDDAGKTLEQAKRYRQHRAIERQSNHSKRVKKALGTRCMGCNFELRELYGEKAEGLIDAHHLTPLASLENGSRVTFDPKRDFAVLCPNCHRVVHRLADPSDLDGLRAEIANAPISWSRAI